MGTSIICIILLIFTFIDVRITYHDKWNRLLQKSKSLLIDYDVEDEDTSFADSHGLNGSDDIVDIAIRMKDSQNDETIAELLANDYNIEYHGMVPELGIRHFRLVQRKDGHNKRSFDPEIFQALTVDPRVEHMTHGTRLERAKREEEYPEWYEEDYASYLRDDDDDVYGINSEEGFISNSQKFIFNDPLYRRQWYYENPFGYDLNVIDAWKKGFSGAGVTICVLDDGLDHNHVELKSRYIANVSYDFNDLADKEHDPSPRTLDAQNGHGTKCAGAAAAEANNRFCGVGVAFNANICGHRILDGAVTPLLEARTIAYRNKYVHIKSLSWGPVDDGKHMEGPHKLVRMAIENGLNKGRYGKGTLFIWASGNGGRNKDHCGADGYVSYPYVIAIGSIMSHGDVPVYSEKCAAILAVVYVGGSSAYDSERNGIVTSEVGNKCTDQFVGTSAAAPIAAGIFALVLEANPDLTYRDVMHLVAKTSRIPSFEEWETWWLNSGGYHVSNTFGFGVLDASQLVQEAQNWVNVGPRRSCSIKANSKSNALRPGKAVELTVDVTKCPGVEQIELVVATISCKYDVRGEIRITLVSPSKTPSELLGFRTLDQSNQEIRQFPFASVQFWGEEPIGTWKLLIETQNTLYKSLYSNGSVSFWKLTFYGTTSWDSEKGMYKNSSHKLTMNEIKQIIEIEKKLRNTKIIAKRTT